MSDRARDWLVAAACCEGPRPAATFADLPRQHQRQIVRIAAATAAAAAYFIVLAIHVRPVPSRSLLTAAALPNTPPVPRPALLDARPIAAIDPPSSQPGAARAARASGLYELAAVGKPSADDRATGTTARQERRGNVFSRFFRGVRRSLQPAAVKADSL
jgi:hypothetical protein